MPKHFEKKIVNFTAKQMYELVADIDNYREFLPWCNDSKIIEITNIDNEKKTLIADLEIGYKDLVYTYRSNVLLNNQELTIKVDFIHGPFKNLDNSWIFKKIDDQSCEIEFFIDFELNVGVLNLLISKFFDKAFKKMVNSFENRANQIYGSK
ncbi:MAG: type II toxin-antitoxin system RatA family toxin [Candidatus Pelagibacterales bacterium]|tara:strand:+ start:278 stop:733 length:456 start_codon:yes stop_codon:yes gene_type:complete